MLNENEVVEALCCHLKAQGYDILQKCSVKQRGIDIIAKHPEGRGRLLIEAKGGAAANPGTARYGKDFDRNQVFDRVAKGFFTAACMEQKSGDVVALAFPDSRLFREYLDKLRSSTEKLGITIYLVQPDCSVTMF